MYNRHAVEIISSAELCNSAQAITGALGGMNVEQKADRRDYLNMLDRPAFVARDGVIEQANEAALHCFLTPGTEVENLLLSGKEELSNLKAGSLCLSICVNGITRDAAATIQEDGTFLFHLQDEEDGARFRVLALAAQQLRQPLSEAMGAASLLQEDWEPENEEQDHRMWEINRSLYRILRQVSNMTELSHLSSGIRGNRETTEGCSYFTEIFEKAAALAEHSGKKIIWSVPEKRFFLPLDRDRVERAVYNLLSNALRYTPKGGRIRISLEVGERVILVKILDKGEGLSAAVRENLFFRFRREPGLEDERSGLGLGLQLVYRVAALHGGTLMVCPGPEGGTMSVLTLGKNLPAGQPLRSPILRVDYSGERDHALVELSGELPSSLYETL